MKFLIDMNLSPLWVPFLESHGLEAIHWSAIGQVSAADSEIFEYAAAHGYVVFTHDLVFGALLAGRGTRGKYFLRSKLDHAGAPANSLAADSVGGLVLAKKPEQRRRAIHLRML